MENDSIPSSPREAAPDERGLLDEDVTTAVRRVVGEGGTYPQIGRTLRDLWQPVLTMRGALYLCVLGVVIAALAEAQLIHAMRALTSHLYPEDVLSEHYSRARWLELGAALVTLLAHVHLMRSARRADLVSTALAAIVVDAVYVAARLAHGAGEAPGFATSFLRIVELGVSFRFLFLLSRDAGRADLCRLTIFVPGALAVSILVHHTNVGHTPRGAIGSSFVTLLALVEYAIILLQLARAQDQTGWFAPRRATRFLVEVILASAVFAFTMPHSPPAQQNVLMPPPSTRRGWTPDASRPMTLQTQIGSQTHTLRLDNGRYRLSVYEEGYRLASTIDGVYERDGTTIYLNRGDRAEALLEMEAGTNHYRGTPGPFQGEWVSAR